MCEVPVRVALGSNTFIDLEYVHACPQHVFFGKSTKHHPWRVASTDGHDETATGRNGMASFLGDHCGRFPGDCICVRKHFNSHFSLLTYVSFIRPPGNTGSHPLPRSPSDCANLLQV